MVFLFRKRNQEWGPLPPGLRIYAIGDLHGRADLLERLHAEIAEELAASPPERALIVYLGDYLDRGFGSAEVLERLLASPLPSLEPVFLKGNHEAMALAFLEDPIGAAAWLEFGGRETLKSYGLEPPGKLDREALLELREAWCRRLPPAHLHFLKGLRLKFEVGDYLFVHAGIDPSRPLSRQRERDLLWMREPFLSAKGPFGKVVVHGHTPVPEPENLPWRINLDTGAFLSGRLTALVLEGGERRFLTVKRERWKRT